MVLVRPFFPSFHLFPLSRSVLTRIRLQGVPERWSRLHVPSRFASWFRPQQSEEEGGGGCEEEGDLAGGVPGSRGAFSPSSSRSALASRIVLAATGLTLSHSAQQRHKLDLSKLTPLTKESFAEWKKTRTSKKEAAQQLINSAKSATAAAGKSTGMSGRDLFTFNPDMLGDDDDADDGEDWDLAVMRARTENEKRQNEIERCVSLLSTSHPFSYLTDVLAS